MDTAEVHYVLGYNQGAETLNQAFRNSLDQIISLGVDSLLKEVLNPFSDSEHWRVFRCPPQEVQRQLAEGEIIYYKPLQKKSFTL